MELLHVHGHFTLKNNLQIEVYYPMIPWMGVMALGYVFGPVLLWPVQKRSQFFIRLGLLFSAAFICLRWLNFYGDPNVWLPQKNLMFTIMTFLNCEKYPPSLLYLLMTLVPACIVLGMLNSKLGEHPISNMLINSGRVPFLFYILHVPIILGLALSLAYLHGGTEAMLSYTANQTQVGYHLPIVYVVWASVITALYFPCLWYGKFKARYRYRVLSYL